MSGAYNSKISRRQGGNEMVVSDGGKIIVEAGGQLVIGDKDFGAALGAIPTADPEVNGAIWLDGGVLKVSLGN